MDSRRSRLNDDLILFGPGRYRFRLPMQRVLEIERLCGQKDAPKPIGTIFEQLSDAVGIRRDTGDPRYIGAGPVHARDVYEVIRCAAIGGAEAEIAGETLKVSAIDATNLVDEYVADGAPGRYAEAIPVAWHILNMTFMGVSLKKKADAAPEDTSPTGAVT